MRHHRTIYLLLAVVLTMASCIKSSDNETTLYSDASVVSFTLGTLNRYLHTTSQSGTDSVYKVTVTGSNYKFHIDQVKHLIYNTDSLPTGTDAAHVICAISALNNGVIGLKSLTSDSIFGYLSTDSIDFSQPRQLLVYASDGSGYTEYTVSVNVHKQNGEDFVWHQLEGNTTLAAMTGLKAVSLKNVNYVFGAVDGITCVLATADGLTWTEPVPNINTIFSKEAWQNVVLRGDSIYMLNNHTLLRCTDGTDWQQVCYDEQLSRLVGASTDELYALSVDNLMLRSTDGGASWTEDYLDDSTDLLPTEHTAYACYPLFLADNTDYVILAGNRSADTYPGETVAKVWCKVVDYGALAPVGEWTFMEHNNASAYALPRMKSLSLIPYDDGVLAFGFTATDEQAAPMIYQSRDNGITWKENSRYVLPADMNLNATALAACVDDEYNIWLFCADTGEVWRGRLNSMGWEYQ